MSKTEKYLIDYGYENVLIFKNYDYDDAFIGISIDNRAVYDYNKMVDCLVNQEQMSIEEAIEWIEYNTIRALDYYSNSPIVIYMKEDI